LIEYARVNLGYATIRSPFDGGRDSQDRPRQYRPCERHQRHRHDYQTTNQHAFTLPEDTLQDIAKMMARVFASGGVEP